MPFVSHMYRWKDLVISCSARAEVEVRAVFNFSKAFYSVSDHSNGCVPLVLEYRT